MYNWLASIGFDHGDGVPQSLTDQWYAVNLKILRDSERIKRTGKRKWVLVAAPTRKELKRLRAAVDESACVTRL